MSESNIQAEPRTEFGKGAARRIRRANKVPAVLYGHGTDPLHLTLPGHDTFLALKHGGANALLTLLVDGKEQLALPKQVQRDPIKGFLEHLDLLLVRRGEKVTVEVPIHVEGQPAADALVVVEHPTLTIEAEATHIPETIVVSVEGAEVGTQILVKDLQVPSGSKALADDEALVVNITHAPTAAEVEAELEDAEADAGIQRDEPEVAEAGADSAAAGSGEGGASTDE